MALNKLSKIILRAFLLKRIKINKVKKPTKFGIYKYKRKTLQLPFIAQIKKS